MGKTGAQMILECFHEEQVDKLFGYPGGAVIPIFDQLFGEKSLSTILTRHEQGAVHAADGYARSTGKVGVCVVTSGPGATNTITGLATANFDSVPLVCITGQVPRAMIGNDAFQEADTSGVTRPITKHNYLVTQRKDLPTILKSAFYIARSGRPGPVVIDIPKDILTAVESDRYPNNISIRGYNPVVKGHPGQVKRAAKAFNQAKKPLFFIGGGIHVSEAQDIFKKIVKKTKTPVVSSLMGISAIPNDDPNYLGMIGMHGTYTANMAVSECDLLFGIGVRFDDRATGELSKFAPNAKIIHIDIDTSAIARNVPVEIPIVGDARQTLENLYPLIEKPDNDEWNTYLSDMQKKYPLLTTESDKTDGISPPMVVKAVSKVFPDAIISSEVGQNQMWAALFYNYQKPRTWLTSGGLGTMGYGFPAAIGAQIGNPDKRVIDIAGDGSIQMNIQELATAVSQRLPVIITILNNGYLGMVRQWQELFYNKRYSSTCLLKGPDCPDSCKGPTGECPVYVPDFVKLAEAYNAVGIRVVDEAGIVPALEKAKSVTDRPVIIDFLIAREADVWPMVPPGAGIQEMLQGKGE